MAVSLPSQLSRRPTWLPAPVSASRTVAILVGGIVVVGMAARIRQYLGRPSYWCDEAYTLLNVFTRSWPDLLGPLDWPQIQPPGFLWILRGLYVVAGPSELAMRLPAVLASLASLVLMIPLARRYVPFGWPWAVALCALSHHGLTHAYEAKPYATDFLVTELILLSMYPALCAADGKPHAGRPNVSLYPLALLAPWLSFPSPFVLGGASLALLVGALRGRSAWGPWFALTAITLTSLGVLWALALRHADAAPHVEHFALAHCFPDGRSIPGWLTWLGGRLFELGHYGTTGMAVPLLALGALGSVVLARRASEQVVLLLAPIALAAVAAAMQRYPLCDRLLFFALPSVWLAAAAGIGVLAAGLDRRFAWVMPAMLALLLVPGATRMARDLVVLQPRTAFRDALEYVHARWSAGDQLWIEAPEMFELYGGSRSAVLGPATPVPVVETAARDGRLWMIGFPRSAGGRPSVYSPYPGLPDHVAAYHEVPGLEIRLFVAGRRR